LLELGIKDRAAKPYGVFEIKPPSEFSGQPVKCGVWILNFARLPVLPDYLGPHQPLSGDEQLTRERMALLAAGEALKMEAQKILPDKKPTELQRVYAWAIKFGRVSF
jgi:hypothetical protein